ncbi:MAG: hypothetical protein ACYSQY_07325 [Planctomycetota bacterium]
MSDGCCFHGNRDGGGVNLCCAGIWPTYNSASGTLPQEQGWIFYDANEPTSPAVVDGLLHQGLTSATGVQGWTDDSRIICFGSTDRFNIYFTLKVIQSDYTVVNNQWDSGFKVWAYDNAGRFACVGISSDGVRLTISSDFSTSSSKSTAFYPMDTTDGFHSYSLSVVHINVWNEDRVNLSIDGNAYTVNAFHYLGQAAQGDYNIVGFGDESISGGSQIELERFGFYVQNSYGLLDEGWLTDIHDLQIFAGQWLRTDCDCDGFCEQADINQDGRVDIKDLSIICDVWLEERSS